MEIRSEMEDTRSTVVLLILLLVCNVLIRENLRGFPHFIQNSAPSLGSKVHLLNQNPPIYQIDDFLSSNEYHYLNQICTQYEKSFANSFTENDQNHKVISEERTSRFIYLSKCQDSFARKIERRAAEFLGVSSTTVEPIQIVSYTQGQYFNLHHDAGTLHDDKTVELVSPRRLATFFIYLNSLPKGEGHTEFPVLGLSVQPKRNSVVVFPNILPTGQPDPRTVHVANVITQKGLRKFGVNIWITDMDMQCLASSPAISPLIQRYDKESPDLILNRLSQLTTEPTSEQRTQPKGKRKINEDGDKIVQKSKVEMKKRRKREMK